MIDQPDKLTETRGSLECKGTFTQQIYRIFCPCITFSSSDSRNTADYFASDLGNYSENQKNIKQFQMPHKNTFNFPPYEISFKYTDETENSEGLACYNMDNEVKAYKSKSFIINSPNEGVKPTIFKQMHNMMTQQKKEWFSYPIYRYNEGELHMIGKNGKNLLVDISTVKLEPSPSAVQKQFMSKKSQQLPNCQVLNDFWDVRYFYFQRFDEGVQIDKHSLYNLTPEIVSDYIAGKCSDCKIALDAFSGIGHNSTKLGTFCQKVICVEQDADKYNYLINNAKCYEMYNVELFLKPFLDIELKGKVDVVLLHPYALDQSGTNSSICQLGSFKPDIKKVIQKAMLIANNIVLLLPPNVNIRDICFEISKSAQQMEKVFCSCSIKVQKIFFRNNLVYVAIFFGPNVQYQVKINSELGFIYKMMKAPDQKHFENKKLIKYMRQKYGMIKLLNFLNESKGSEYDGQNRIEKFINYIRYHKLILEHKLHKIINDDLSFSEKKSSNRSVQSSFASNEDNDRKFVSYTIEEHQDERIEEEEENMTEETNSERTQSYISNVSGFSGFKKRATLANSIRKTQKGSNSDPTERDSENGSIIIKKEGGQRDKRLEKESKSPATINKVSLHANRGSVQVNKIQNELHLTEKEKLRKGLLQSGNSFRYEL